MNKVPIQNYLQVHLIELKYNFFILLITFFYLFSISYYFSNQLIYVFTSILIENNVLEYFIFSNITELFIINTLISFFISLFISSQIFIIQLWVFISPGLFKYENIRFIKMYTFFSIFSLLVLPFILIYISPNMLSFFINIKNSFSNQYLFSIYFEPNLNSYFYFVFILVISIYTIYIYLFILLYLILNKIFYIKILTSLRKFFYIKFILISSILSPPDFFSQISIILFFIFFFEILILFYLFFNRYFFKKT